MKRTANDVRRAVSGFCMVLLFGLAAAPASAQTSDITANLQVNASGSQEMEMMYFLSGDRLRMDMQDVSIVSISGSDPSMLMIQHAEQRYLLFDGQQLQMMQQMMSQFGGGNNATAADTDFSRVHFEATGETDQIGPWSAFEVQMTGPEGQEGMLWLTTDTDVGLFEIMAGAMDAVSALSNPMAGAGGGGAVQQFLQYQALAQAQGLPDGQVVRIVSTESGGETMITLTSVDTGAVPADTFEPPAGYQEMQLPALGGLFGQ